MFIHVFGGTKFVRVRIRSANDKVSPSTLRGVGDGVGGTSVSVLGANNEINIVGTYLHVGVMARSGTMFSISDRRNYNAVIVVGVPRACL